MKSTPRAVDANAPAFVGQPQNRAKSTIVALSGVELSRLVHEAVTSVLHHLEREKTPRAALLSGAQMAARLGISRSKMNALRLEGCPSVKIGNLFKFDEVSVLEWLKERSDEDHTQGASL